MANYGNPRALLFSCLLFFTVFHRVLPVSIIAVNRARSVMNLYDKVPEIGRNAFVAPSALVAGNVSIGSNSSVFYGSIIRGMDS